MDMDNKMNYREWQKRNTKHFGSLSKLEQKQARNQGYYNVGWVKVKKSWQIICKFTNNVSSLFEHKLNKGDLVGAIELSMIEALDTKRMAQKTINDLEMNEQRLTKIADQALAKHTLL
ncbi:MAG: hypothetical protein F6J92_38710 [Symploca sp. SIO1A3]|nr:hypothetical protein [Symploca sp. SIO1A3]